MTEDQLAAASEMWIDGRGTKAIAAMFGLTNTALTRVAAANRSLFPKRTILRGGRWFAATYDGCTAPKRERRDTMLWCTKSGAMVTLPKISSITCPRSPQQASELMRERWAR